MTTPTTRFGFLKPSGSDLVDEVAHIGAAYDAIDRVIPKLLGHKRITTNSVPITGETPVPNSAVDFTIDSGRVVEFTFGGQVLRSVANGTSILGIRLNPIGFFVHHLNFQPVIVNEAVPGHAVIIRDDLPPGNYGAYLTLRLNSGTGTTTLIGSDAAPSYLIVKDIGPKVY